MMHTSDKIVAAVGVALLACAVLGISTCVTRDRRFEDACRRAGGIVLSANAVSPSATSTRDVCVQQTSTPSYQPLPLPEYKP